MKQLFLSLLLAVVSSLWTYSGAQCFVSAPEQEGPYVENVTGILMWDAYPCIPDEECPPCLTLVLRTTQATYYLTGSKVEEFVFPEETEMLKVIVSGITDNNGTFNWLKVNEIRISEEPITTNIDTYGYIQDENETKLPGIAVIVHSADWSVSDTVYSKSDGSFISAIRNIPYPVASMDVTAKDFSEMYEAKTFTTSYTYDCGMDFNPETNIASNMLPLIFALKKVTNGITNITKPNCAPKKIMREGNLLIENNGHFFNALGAEVK